jgi:hypothetical protein
VADPREKAMDLARKLMRTAAPTSGATISERTTAALHAAELIAQHELEVSIPPPPVKKQRGPRPGTAYPPSYPPPPVVRRYPGSEWTEVKLSTATTCAHCGEILHVGENVFFEPTHQVFIHYEIGCAT